MSIKDWFKPKETPIPGVTPKVAPYWTDIKGNMYFSWKEADEANIREVLYKYLSSVSGGGYMFYNLYANWDEAVKAVEKVRVKK